MTGMPSFLASATAIFFLVGVDDDHDVRQAAHFLDAAQGERSSLSRSRVSCRVSFLVRPVERLNQQLLQLPQTADGVGNGLPVGQCAAEPAMVHVELGAALRGFGHRAGCLALGADEQHAAATGRPRRARPSGPRRAAGRSGKDRQCGTPLRAPKIYGSMRGFQRV